ncbi:respiratory chain complex I subunit 1 family protein [Thermococcus barophilus]|uniref:Membrane bound subgroup 4b [NiFe]-hydrogenase MBH(B)1, subunit Mbh(B)1M n=1 Tax=Thermococcus barophilus TaxID=55802 RepID=A0A0S1XA23_THEBA|nr:NADH-quinone oxidoreductase subunit H [Thermococcus barophilus]ALM74615.1 Membrane bound subgroup 4b [NiFe]-hydrogenase MBH(b)1, subunit Mbh(b)1M [Thermococcus barophilus]
MQWLALIIVPIIVPLLDGLSRKLKAAIQHRVGPPITQTWYDFLSWLPVEPIYPTDSLIFRLTPYLTFASAIAMLLFLPFGNAPLAFEGDAIAFLYFFAMMSAFIILGAMSVNSTYTQAGASREITLSLAFKPAFGIVLGVFALKTGSLSIVTMASSLPMNISTLLSLCLLAYLVYVESGFIPYDIAEAETEILEGVLSEYSGRLLVLMKWALLIKRFAMLWLLSSFIVLPFVKGLEGLIGQVMVFMAIFIAMTTYEALNARYTINQAVRKGLYATLLGIVVLLIAYAGW